MQAAQYSSRAKASDYYVAPTTHAEAKALVVRYHYARGGSNTGCYTHGLYRASDNELVGVAWWLPPTKVAAMSVNGSAWEKVLSLSRLVVADGEPKNAASILLGASIRAIKKAGRFTSLVTYADVSQGHTGTIYKATNWTYAGLTRPRARWINPITGQQVAGKSTVNRTKQQMLEMGYSQTASYPKHKFVMYLA